MALQSDHEFAPAQIEQADFPTAFRGYDQDAVRRYLTRLAGDIEHQQRFAALGDLDIDLAAEERVVELEQEVEALAEQLTKEKARAKAARRANGTGSDSGAEPVTFEGLDEAKAIELLGRETARVLESARSAAADIVKRAEEKVASREREAQEKLIKARREARSVVAEKKAEADRLVAKVADDAEARARRLTEEAEQHRESVVAESAAVLRDAEEAAAEEETAARDRAAQIVGDAEALRRQVLAELVEERVRARSELEEVIGTRDRLTLALTVARGDLDSMMSSISTSESSLDARAADTAAAAAVADGEVDQLIADLDGTPAAPAAEPDQPAPAAKPTSKKPPTKSRKSAKPKPKPRPKTKTKPTAAGADAPAKDAQAEPAPEEEPAAAIVEEATSTADIEKNGLIDGFQTIDLLDDASDGSDAIADGTSPARAGTRSTRRNGSSGGAKQKARAKRSPLDEVITTVVSRSDGGDSGGRTRGDLLLEEPFVGRLPAGFKARDVALAKHGPNFRRQLRRALNDDQSEVLDRLRTGRGPIEVAELPEFDRQLGRFVGPLRDGLTELASAGLRAGGGGNMVDESLDNLVDQIARYLVGKVRMPTIAALEQASHDDRERILEPIRGHYREFRNESLTELADDALYEAFAIGLYEAIDLSEPVRWRIDPRSDPDPVCEINAGVGQIERGEAFPSGHSRPLSLPGCRCLVTVAG